MQLESEELWNQYYKETIHRIEDIVLWYNSKGVLINWNSAAVQYLGYEGKELSELSIYSLFTSELPFVIQEDAPYYQEWSDIPVYRKNRTCFISSVRVMTIKDVHVYGICILENVQKIKDLQNQVAALSRELEHANEVKNLFLANVTHELRTPLNGMLGLLAMTDTSALSEKTKEDYDLLKECCHTMEKIVDQILNYTKMMAGKLESTKETFVVKQWLAPIIKINLNLAQYKGLSFDTRIDELPPILQGDKEWIGQVLNNLLSNAIKFTKQGSVRLEIVKKEETVSHVSVLFVVSDTGIGIKEEHLKDLFQSFSQADSSITRKYGGTGLGLAISKGYVEAMGGTLEVESKYLKGSRFYFELVLGKEDSTKLLEKMNRQHRDTDNQGKDNNEGHQDLFTLVGESRVNEQEINDLLRQISLCIEFGSWERAQVYSHQMKNLLKGLNPDLCKWAFRLELASRRKDFKKAKDVLEGLKVVLECD